MADKALGVVIGSVLNKVLELVAEEISLAWGVKKELGKLADKLEMIQALLADAQSKQLTSKPVQLWLKRLQSISLDAEMVLDDIGYEVLRENIECRKRDRAVQLINSLPNLGGKRLTTPYVDDSKIVRRENDVSKVISMLVGSEYNEELPVITILGMGGQGKKTLAQLIYKNNLVKSHFDKAVWVCASDDFNVERLLGQMLQSLTGTNYQLTNVEALVNQLKDQLRGKIYLLVLDDVWNDNGDEWDRMKTCLLKIGGSKESKILATTRSKEVGSAMQTSVFHRLQVLSEDQSWALFEKCAFAQGGVTETPQLVEVGKRISKRCGGVPYMDIDCQRSRLSLIKFSM